MDIGRQTPKSQGGVFKLEGWEHDWIPSTLGHGSKMCRRCFMTDREARILGKCQTTPKTPAKEQDNAV